ncbi:MAG: tyrosine-type recombinase/integrase [Nitrososphaerales archaeon]
MPSLGGFRLGTLEALRYYHVAEDLERGIVPVHVQVETEITKGKYHAYDTFLGNEAVEYLQLYLENRRMGSPCGKMPPETIKGDSPLIASLRSCGKPLTTVQIYRAVHSLYLKAGLISLGGRKRYMLRPHSIRKYFRTQLAAHGVPRDYIEYMMGHAISVYHDVRMKGIEHLRNVYASSGISIRPKTKVNKVEMLKAVVKSMGMDPDKVLVKEALTEPHRIYMDDRERLEDAEKILAAQLKEMLRRELLNGNGKN